MENETRIDELEKKLSSLENKLKAALRQDDELEVPMPLRGTLVSTFKGEMTKYSIITWIWLAVSAIAAVGCFIAFDQVSSTKMQLLFITLALIAVMNTVLIKLWYWQIWNRYSVVREVKHLEFRIAELTEKLSIRFFK